MIRIAYRRRLVYPFYSSRL